MSGDEACRRIHAARVVRRFPDLLVRIEQGDLTLSTIALLDDALTNANYDEIVEAAAGKTKAEVQALLAKRIPVQTILREALAVLTQAARSTVIRASAASADSTGFAYAVEHPMPRFPSFMIHPPNRIATSSQHTAGVEGYVFDGADGSQMAFWTVERDAETAEHVHEFDEWFVVVEGSYMVMLDGVEKRIAAGQECFIPKGIRISGRVVAGTRTVHAFGGRRARRRMPGTP